MSGDLGSEAGKSFQPGVRSSDGTRKKRHPVTPPGHMASSAGSTEADDQSDTSGPGGPGATAVAGMALPPRRGSIGGSSRGGGSDDQHGSPLAVEGGVGDGSGACVDGGDGTSSSSSGGAGRADAGAGAGAGAFAFGAAGATDVTQLGPDTMCYYAFNGDEINGPAPLAHIQHWVQEGQLPGDTHIIPEGNSEGTAGGEWVLCPTEGDDFAGAAFGGGERGVAVGKGKGGAATAAAVRDVAALMDVVSTLRTTVRELRVDNEAMVADMGHWIGVTGDILKLVNERDAKAKAKNISKANARAAAAAAVARQPDSPGSTLDRLVSSVVGEGGGVRQEGGGGGTGSPGSPGTPPSTLRLSLNLTPLRQGGRRSSVSSQRSASITSDTSPSASRKFVHNATRRRLSGRSSGAVLGSPRFGPARSPSAASSTGRRRSSVSSQGGGGGSGGRKGSAMSNLSITSGSRLVRQGSSRSSSRGMSRISSAGNLLSRSGEGGGGARTVSGKQAMTPPVLLRVCLRNPGVSDHFLNFLRSE